MSDDLTRRLIARTKDAISLHDLKLLEEAAAALRKAEAERDVLERANAELNAEISRLYACRDEVQDVTAAMDDPAINNTRTLEQAVRALKSERDELRDQVPALKEDMESMYQSLSNECAARIEAEAARDEARGRADWHYDCFCRAMNASYEARYKLARAVELLRECRQILGADVLTNREIGARIDALLSEREADRPAAQPTWTECPRCKNVLARCDCDAARQEGAEQ